jgi:ParB family transcriptional regulator, chromosome partitioning protein
MEKISLVNRKRIGDLTVEPTQADSKKEELLALKISQLNKKAVKAGRRIDIEIHKIMPDPNQPRKVFTNIDSLANSIQAQGIIQPIIVREEDDAGMYHIIAGERRYRAAKQIGLLHLPCIIREEKDADILILQLLENDQREKVSPFEEADALAELINIKKLKKGEVARSLGHDNSWVSMRLKLANSTDALRSLSTDGFIDDVRTLYELKKLESNIPEAATNFISKVRNKSVRGSYRKAIMREKENWLKAKEGKESFTRQGSDEVSDIYFEDDMLIIKLENKSTVSKLQLSNRNVTKLYRELQARIK